MNTQTTVNDEESRIYIKPLSIPSKEKDIRMEKGDKWKAQIVAAAKKNLQDNIL